MSVEDMVSTLYRAADLPAREAVWLIRQQFPSTLCQALLNLFGFELVLMFRDRHYPWFPEPLQFSRQFTVTPVDVLEDVWREACQSARPLAAILAGVMLRYPRMGAECNSTMIFVGSVLVKLARLHKPRWVQLAQRVVLQWQHRYPVAPLEEIVVIGTPGAKDGTSGDAKTCSDQL